MSRLCVKNIPKYADEESIKKHFYKCFENSGANGQITDVKVLKTKHGVSRKMAFIGFKDEKHAALARKYFHKSFMDTCKLSVEEALPYGDSKLSKPWSKHSKPVSSKAEVTVKKASSVPNSKTKDKKLQEFLALMQPKSKSQFWSNDDGPVSINDGNDTVPSPMDEGESERIAESAIPKARQEEVRAETNDQVQNHRGIAEDVADSGRLFVRNLSYSTTEDELKVYFEKYGSVVECHIPVDESKRSRGFGYITYLFAEHAVAAMTKLDMTIFQGRLLHIIPALSKQSNEEIKHVAGKGSSYQQEKEAERKKKAESHTVAWNSLFVRSDAALSHVAKEMGVDKGEILDETMSTNTSAALRMALSETRVITETKEFLKEEGVDLKALEHGIRNPDDIKRSKTCILVKNLPNETNVGEIQQMFAKFGSIDKFVLPPSKTMALVLFHEKKCAKRCFTGLAYKRYKRVPIYLEWAPENTMVKVSHESEENSPDQTEDAAQNAENKTEDLTSTSPVNTLYIKNLNFETTEEDLTKHFIKIGSRGDKNAVIHVSIPKKNNTLSMGFGFVQMSNPNTCKLALRRVHNSTLNGHVLEVKLSRKVASATAKGSDAKRKEVQGMSTERKNSKIIVRNIAFEATKKELKQLFSSYGQINSLRLPKKFDGNHRGFAFVDFVTNQEARAAFEALATTHLYGRKLVIEWAKNDNNLETLQQKAQDSGQEPKPKRQRK